MNSQTCISLIDEQFSGLFKNCANRKVKFFIQDEDPSEKIKFYV